MSSNRMFKLQTTGNQIDLSELVLTGWISPKGNEKQRQLLLTLKSGVEVITNSYSDIPSAMKELDALNQAWEEYTQMKDNTWVELPSSKEVIDTGDLVSVSMIRSNTNTLATVWNLRLHYRNSGRYHDCAKSEEKNVKRDKKFLLDILRKR